MQEKLLPRNYSRREFLIKSTVFAGCIIGIEQRLTKGIIIDSPSLAMHSKKVNIDWQGIDLIGNVPSETEFRQNIIYINPSSYVHYNNNGDLIFQHENSKFDPNREYNFFHRSGNQKGAVDKAISLGANGFDIDATDSGDGKIYAEHGIVKSKKFGPLSIGGVFDVDEKELRFRHPKSVSSMIDYIGTKSDPQDPYVIEIELKRGNFNNYLGLTDIIESITRNELPVRVFSQRQNCVDKFFTATYDYSLNSNAT